MNRTRITGISIVLMVILILIQFPSLFTIFEYESVNGEKKFLEIAPEYNHKKDFSYVPSRAVSEIENMSPKNGSIINTTIVTLSWEISEDKNEPINFSVYMGESKDKMLDKYISVDESLILKNLSYNKTYFWKIVPENYTDSSISESPIYSFSIMKQGSTVTSLPAEETDYLPIILGMALLLFVIIAFVVMRVQRRKDEMEIQELDSNENDTIDAEIEHVPEPGKARSAYGTRPAFEPETRGSVENPLYQQDERIPVAENEVPTASVISLIKAMEMLRARTVAARQRDDFDISKIHLPTEGELGSTADQASEEVFMLPAPKVIEVKKELQKVPIDELFLITPSGLLVQHYSLERESGLNEDVLAGMLTAVK